MTSTPWNNARCWLALATGRGRSRRTAPKPTQDACVGSALRAVSRGALTFAAIRPLSTPRRTLHNLARFSIV